jgi:cysteine desulfurase
MSERIYLDYAATTPLRPEAKEAMEPWLTREYGNPSSLYLEGRRAKDAIDAAREVVSSALGCLFGEVVFTSSGTEACNLAMLGCALGATDRRRFLVSNAEHHAVVNTRNILESLIPAGGLELTYDPFLVDSYGRPDLEVLSRQIGGDTVLVAAMHANNELGTITYAREIADLAHQYNAYYFCDAVQTFPWCNGKRWTVDELGADLLAVSAHKLGGPKGVGALYIRSGTRIEPTMFGGGQEREMRAGTENVAAIVGFAAALQASLKDTTQDERKRKARDAFRRALIEEDTPRLHLMPDMSDMLPGHCHLRFEGVSAESLLILLDRLGVSASAGAACSSGSIQPSHVLRAIGWTDSQAAEGVRFTFGGQTTVDEALEAARRVAEAARSIAASRDS